MPLPAVALPAPEVAAPAGLSTGFLRLASCASCQGRRRALVEVGGELRGRCLECGSELSLPLRTERAGREAAPAAPVRQPHSMGPDD